MVVSWDPHEVTLRFVVGGPPSSQQDFEVYSETNATRMVNKRLDGFVASVITDTRTCDS